MKQHTFGFHHAICSLTTKRKWPLKKLQPKCNFCGKCNWSVKQYNTFILYHVYCKNYASLSTASRAKIHYLILFTIFFCLNVTVCKFGWINYVSKHSKTIPDTFGPQHTMTILQTSTHSTNMRTIHSHSNLFTLLYLLVNGWTMYSLILIYKENYKLYTRLNMLCS